MTIAENMFLGNERGSKYRIDWNETNDLAAQYLEMVGLNEAPQVLIKDIGVGKQQLVEIAKRRKGPTITFRTPQNFSDTMFAKEIQRLN